MRRFVKFLTRLAQRNAAFGCGQAPRRAIRFGTGRIRRYSHISVRRNLSMLKKVSSIPFHGTAEQEAQLKAVIEENKHDKSMLMHVMQQAQQLRRDARALRGLHVREHDGRDVARRIEHRDFIFPFHFSGLHGGHSVKWTWLLM